MKTHLPVALRKALLAALVAVSFSTYNQAFAYQAIINSDGINVTFDDENGDGGDTVNSSGKNVNVEGPIASDNNKIITGTAAINVLQGISGDGNSISTTSGNVTTGDISGANTSIMSESGNVEVGNITKTATGTTIETNTGDLTTGDIAASDITITKKGAGKLAIGAITGTNVQMKAESATLSNLSSMSGTTLDVAEIDTPDTNAELNGSSITSTGNVKIGAPEADSTEPEADTLKLTNGSSIAAAGDTATMTIDQNVSLAGASSLSTKGGNLTITENASLAGGSSISSTGGNVEIGSLGDSENSSIDVSSGNLTIGTSAAKVVNANFSAGGDIVLGTTAGDDELLTLEGSGKTSIDATGDLKVNQSVTIAPDKDTDATSVITAGGSMHFLGEKTKIQGEATGMPTQVTAGKGITFKNEGGTEIADHVNITAKEENISISVDGAAAYAEIIGNLTAEKGDITVSASTIRVMQTEGKVTNLEALGDITLNASQESGLQYAALLASDVTINGDKTANLISSSVQGENAVLIHGGTYTHLTNSTVKDSKTVLIGQKDEQTPGTSKTKLVNSEVSASGNVAVGGAFVEITDNQGITSTGDAVKISSDNGNISISGDKVTAYKSVTIDATAAAKLNDVEVSGGGLVDISGSSVEITDNKGITSTGESVKISSDKGNISINGDEVTAYKSVTIDATAAAKLNDVEVSGADLVDISGSSVEITDNKGITSTGDAVKISSDKGNISINGDEVTADKSVTIAANAKATLTNVKVSGDSASITGTTNTIQNGAEVVADTVVTIDAATGNEILSGSKVTAGEDVYIDGPTNTIDGDGTVVTGETKVNITGKTANTISGNAQVVSNTDSVIIDGDTTAANTIEGTNTLVDAAANVDIDGATNTIRNGAEVVAGTDVTIDAATSNSITLGASVEADKSVRINGAEKNIISLGAGVLAKDGRVTIDGGETSMNLISGTGTSVEARGTDGMVDMEGKSNIITAAATVTAATGVELDAAVLNRIESGSKVTAGEVVTMTGVANLITTDAQVLAETGIDITSTGSEDNHGNLVSASTVQTKTGDVDITATMHNHVTAGAGVTATNGDVNLRGKSNTINDAAHVQAGDVAFIKADEKNTITGNDTKVTAGRTAWIQGADNEISAGAQVNGEDYATIKATGENIITGAGTKVTAGVTAQVFGENNEISAEAQVNGDRYVMIDATGHNRIFGDQTLVQGGNNVQIIAGTYNEVDAASVKTTVQGGVALKAVENNFVQNGALVNTRGGSITLTSAGDATTVANTVTGEDTRLVAETYVKLDGKNNTITKNAVVTGLTNVTARAEENNLITEGAKVFALNDDASVTLTAGAVNRITDSATKIYAGKDVSMTAETTNIINAAIVTAMNGAVTMGNAVGSTDTVVNNIQAAATVTAGTDVRMTGAINTILTGSGVTATQNVIMTGATQNDVSESTVKAGADVTLTGDKATVDNAITESTVTAGNNVAMTGENNTIMNKSAVNAGNDAILDANNNNLINSTSKLTAAGSVDMDAVANNIISDSGTQVYAGETVSIKGKNNAITSDAKVIGMQGVDITAGENNNVNAGAQVLGYGAGASVKLVAGGDNLIAGSASLVYADKDVILTAEDGNTVDAAKVAARTGDITLRNSVGSTVAVVNTIKGAAQVTAAGDVRMTGDTNAILAGSTVTAGMDVTLTADSRNAVANSTVTAKHGSIFMGDADDSTETVQNVVTAAAGQSTTLTAGQDVTIIGKNIITSVDSGRTGIMAQNGNITINDDNYIRNAAIAAGGVEGDVYITTGTGDKTTWVADTGITGETVTIAGDISDDRSAANLAVVTGAETKISSKGEDEGVGITLNNVSVQDTDTVKGDSNIIAMDGGNIVLLNRVDMKNSTLTIENGTTSDARIVLDAGNVLNTKTASSLEGRLTGTGDINKSGGDELLLDYDHTEFNGSIYANGAVGSAAGNVADASNTGSWIKITSGKVGTGQKAGVGEKATIVLKSTDLIINTTEAQIGTLDTTQDEAGMNNVHTTGGTLVSLGGDSDGSYTMDGNTRVDFTTVGSVLEVNKGTSGDVVHATNMMLSDATLLKLDATVDDAGQVSSDIIEAAGTINVAAKRGLNNTSTAAAPSTARVYINHTNMAAAAKAAEGARTTIMTGTMITDINEDVLYDVEKIGNGTYQRVLQERNAHLENDGDHVNLVFSKNYRSAKKTDQMQKVADALREVSDAIQHSEGTLAASENRLHNLIDAFDYTRSEGAARRGLQSVAGTGNLVPQLMLFDSSRHHLNNLRKQIEMPRCSRALKGAPPNRRNNAWVTYTGAYDRLNGDSYLGDYARTAHGAMLGMDASVTCKLRLGLSLGYENSIGRADSTRVDADTFFVDAYAAGVTGCLKHRASIGLATTQFNTRRGVAVEAGYHSFYGSGHGDTEAITMNLGYEISSDCKMNERSTLTRYAAINLAWHRLDTLLEQGMGEAGLASDYDKEWQADLAFGLSYNRLFTALPNQNPAQFYATAAVHVELLDDRVSANNRFRGAAVSWDAASMEREPLYFEFGAGVTVPLSPAWRAIGGAAVEVGPERTSFSGNIGVRYSF